MYIYIYIYIYMVILRRSDVKLRMTKMRWWLHLVLLLRMYVCITVDSQAAALGNFLNYRLVVKLLSPEVVVVLFMDSTSYMRAG
jgi:hypothetical protein